MTNRFPNALATFIPDLAPLRYAHTLAFSQDGKRLAVTYTEYPNGDSGGGVRDLLVQWDLTRPATPVIGTGSSGLGSSDGLALAYAPNGSLLVSSCGGVLVYPPFGEEPTSRIFLQHSVTMKALALAPDGGWALAAVSNHLCECHLGETEKRQDWEQRHQDDISCLAFSADGRFLASGAVRKPYVHVWDVARKTQLKRLMGHQGGVFCLAFSPDSTLLASGGLDRLVTVREVSKTWNVRHTLEGHTHYMTSLAFSPDGKLLVSASSHLEKGDGLRIWDPVTGAALGHINWPGACVEKIAFSLDGTYLAVVEWTGAGALWETARLLQ